MGHSSEDLNYCRKPLINLRGQFDAFTGTGAGPEGSSDDSDGGQHKCREELELDEWQPDFCKLFPKLFSRIGHIRKAKVRADFFDILRTVQLKKKRRVPISLQDKVEREITRLIQAGRIVKLEERSDKHSVSPIVITVKKDGSLKLAFESRELNKQVHKNKYQIPNIEELLDGISRIIGKRKYGEVYFTTLGLTYLYGQVDLETKTSEHCNFSLVGGKSTGFFSFQNGLTTTPAEVQKSWVP